MPTTKFSFIRCRILDKCFRSPKLYQIQDLIDACEKELNMSISRRTIYYDIDFMKSNDGWNAPIEPVKDGNRSYYRYTDPDFSIDKVPLSEAQLKQLQSAVDVLKTVEGLPQFEGLNDSLEKIGMMAYDTEAEHCFELDHNNYVGGTEHITPLFNAIQYQTVQNIHYKPFGEEEKEHVFHPQFLKQYNNRWYIFGIEQEHPEEVWNLALDRIVSIKPTKLPYIKIDMDWQDYFSDIIGVTNYKDAPVEEVHFVVHGKTAHYLYTKPIHESQIPHWNEDGSLDVKLKVKINYELKRLLLSYAADITILSPQSLVEEHKESLKKALEQYQ